MSLSAALSLPARTTDAPRRSNVSLPIHRCGLLEVFRARGSGIQKQLAASRLGLDGRSAPAHAISPASQSGHLRDPSLALTRPWSPTGFGSRQVTVLYRWARVAPSALFRPRTMTDSPALHPLHSAVANRFAGCADAIASFRRPQTGETVKNIRACPKTAEAAMLRMSPRTKH